MSQMTDTQVRQTSEALVGNLERLQGLAQIPGNDPIFRATMAQATRLRDWILENIEETEEELEEETEE